MRNPIDLLNNRKLLPLALVFGTLVAGILIGTVISGSADAARESDEPITDATPLTVPPADPVENQFAELARRLRPSVVSIIVRVGHEEELEAQRSPFNRPEDFFRRFFGMPPERQGQPQPRRRGPGQGSGIIVDPKGYIITNQHVVDGADEIKVVFADDEELYDAKLIGADIETDLAVIHVEDKQDPPAAKIGNSDSVNVGDWAIAIGSPFGYRETVTVGIISAKAREMGSGFRSRPFRKFLQTDAAINPGNSGGPLLNIRGEVVGINSAIISRTGGYDGIGFALASNIAVDTYNQIVRFGRVSRGSIGVGFRERSLSLLRSYGSETGVFVTQITDGGPADKSGMKAEDIIISVDGTETPDGDKLIEVVAATRVGRTVPIEVIRGGKKMTLHVKIEDRDKVHPEDVAVRLDRSDAGEASVRFGITVQEIDPQTRNQMELDVDSGVLLTKVERGSFGDDVGLRQGDVILAVNRIGIGSIRDLHEVQEMLKPGQDVAFKAMRVVRGQWETIYPAGVLPE